MGIGGISSINNMSAMQMTTAASAKPKIKSIQNEIAATKQQMQKLSSKEELSVNEKTNERKKLQKEITSLNTELKLHQDELSRSQKKKIMPEGLQTDSQPANKETSESKIQTNAASADKADEKNLPAGRQQAERQGNIIFKNDDGIVIQKGEMKSDEKRGIETVTNQSDKTNEKGIAEKETKTRDNDTVTDIRPSRKEMNAMLSADSSVRQAGRQGSIIARTRDGIAILKGEMKLDEQRGADTEKKQAELEKMEKREERAASFQFSILGESDNTMKSAAETNAAGINITQANQANTGNNAFVNAMNISQTEGSAAQQFHVSLG